MAKQSINVGASANDKKGDSLRAAFQKVNSNFTELYTALGLDTGGLNLGAFEFVGSTMSTTDSTSIIIDQATTITSDLTVGGDIVPSVAQGGNLGSLSRPFNSLYVSTSTVYLGGVPLSLEPGTNELRVNNIPISQNITYESIPNAPTDVADLTDTQGLLSGGGAANLGNIKIDNNYIGTKNFPDTGSWGGYDLILDPGGESSAGLYIPSIANQQSSTALLIYSYADGGRIVLGTNDGVEITSNGNDAKLLQNNAFTRVTNSSNVVAGPGVVVWSSAVDYISSAKLVIQVECNETGDNTGWHSQSCEAIIACRGYANSVGGPLGDPSMTVYGVTHTSVDPLVTFTVQRNPTTNIVEVVGTLTAAASGNAAVKIHSIEMSTRD